MTTPDPTGDALKAGDRILMLLGGYRDYMGDEAVEAFQCLADELNAARTPPTVSLDEVAEVLTECIAALENSDPRWPSIERRARDLLTRIKERHAPSQS
jgi:hypothetical protein